MLESLILLEENSNLEASAVNSQKEDIYVSSKFYPSKSHQVVLSNIHSFSKGNKTLGVLLGAVGSGKTTLLEFFQKENPERIIHYMQGHAKMTLATFWAEFTTLLNEVDNQESQEKLLLIDDADSLAFEILTAIVCYICEQMQAKIRIILAGESNLQKKLIAINEKNNFLYHYQEFFLEPISFTEIKNYLYFTFNYLLSDKGRLLTLEMQQRIYTLSEGYPGRINRVTHQILVDSKKQLKVVKPGKNLFDICLKVGVFLFVIAIGLQVFNISFHSFIPKYASKPSQPIRVVQKSPIVIKPIQSPPPSFVASITNLPVEKIIRQIPVKVVHSAPTFTSTSSKPVNITKQLKVISLPQTAKGFTLQLLASQTDIEKPSWLKPELHKQMHTFRIRKGEQKWYVLTYGNYSSSKEANAALNKLPQEIKDHKPWIRSLKGIHAELVH